MEAVQSGQASIFSFIYQVVGGLLGIGTNFVARISDGKGASIAANTIFGLGFALDKNNRSNFIIYAYKKLNNNAVVTTTEISSNELVVNNTNSSGTILIKRYTNQTSDNIIHGLLGFVKEV